DLHDVAIGVAALEALTDRVRGLLEDLDASGRQLGSQEADGLRRGDAEPEVEEVRHRGDGSRVGQRQVESVPVAQEEDAILVDLGRTGIEAEIRLIESPRPLLVPDG